MKKELFIAFLSWVMFFLLCVNIRWVNELNTITNEIAIFSDRNFDSTENLKGILNNINIALCKEYSNRAVSFVRKVPQVEYDEYIRIEINNGVMTIYQSEITINKEEDLECLKFKMGKELLNNK